MVGLGSLFVCSSCCRGDPYRWSLLPNLYSEVFYPARIMFTAKHLFAWKRVVTMHGLLRVDFWKAPNELCGRPPPYRDIDMLIDNWRNTPACGPLSLVLGRKKFFFFLISCNSCNVTNEVHWEGVLEMCGVFVGVHNAVCLLSYIDTTAVGRCSTCLYASLSHKRFLTVYCE